MHERKARMAELADGFIVLPGGFGTLDESPRCSRGTSSGCIAKPVVLLDVDGYWGPLFEWMSAPSKAGFVRGSHRMLAQRAAHVDEAIAMATGAGARRRPQVARPRRHPGDGHGHGLQPD